MKYCPITYEVIHQNEDYSKDGLRLLSPRLKGLVPLAFSAAEQRAEAIAHAGKMSIQGVQSKLSAVLKISEERFQIVDQKGAFILKPQSEHYPELPENEAITMSLAEIIGIDVPVHGLVYSKDNSMTYFIRRFDRVGRGGKIAVEDFSQLSQHSRETKYNSSMEKVAAILQKYCSFHKIEAVKLFKLVLFNFLIGNEDMHLKNFSLLSKEGKTTLAPAYDLLNTTIAQRNTKEELALPLNGKKNNLKRADFVDYYASEQLQLNDKVIAAVLTEIKEAIPQWSELIKKSFLSSSMQEKYLDLLEQRAERLELK
ncbi:MAG: HipA domain-containing protein [Gammaproteobacteria bacterium]|nr:HipA domain-containing protein [Gammaproteobacteria bacterium]